MSDLTGASIPHTIHQIWIGNNPEPRTWTDTVRSFAKKAGWDYKLWREADIASLDEDIKRYPGLLDIFGAMSGQIPGRVDILRYLILEKHGGLYIDADCVVMNPDKLEHFLKTNKASAFFAWETVPEATRKSSNLKDKELVANSIIGARAGHPFFHELLKGILDGFIKSPIKDPWVTTGPFFVTVLYRKLKDTSKGEGIHVYPMSHFYPRHWTGVTDANAHTKITSKNAMFFQYGYSTNQFDKVLKGGARGRVKRLTRVKRSRMTSVKRSRRA